MPKLCLRINQIQGLVGDGYVFWVSAGTTEQYKISNNHGTHTVQKLFEFNYNNNIDKVEFSIKKGSMLLCKLIIPISWLPKNSTWVSDWFPVRDIKDGNKCVLAQIDIQICDSKVQYFAPNLRGYLMVAPAWNRPGAPAVPPGPPPMPGAPVSNQPGYYLQSQAMAAPPPPPPPPPGSVPYGQPPPGSVPYGQPPPGQCPPPPPGTVVYPAPPQPTTK